MKLEKDLENRGINVVCLGENATFDLIIEGDRPYVVELKRVMSPPPGLPWEKKERGFRFTETQHSEIAKMKFPPLVLAFDEKGYYWFDPALVKREVKERDAYKKAIFASGPKTETPEFEVIYNNPLTYEDLLKKLEAFVKRSKH
jgi:hypothetical protein